MNTDRDHLSRAEINKDALQEGVEVTVQAVGRVTTIVIGAVGEVARTVGGLATELFEIRDSVRRARADHDVPSAPPGPTLVPPQPTVVDGDPEPPVTDL